MIDRNDHIVMNCRDVETTASWYERALGFKREAYTSPANGSRSSLDGRISTSGGPAAQAGRHAGWTRQARWISASSPRAASNW